MKKIILHVGAGKTGTSALQSHFALNRIALSKEGICYPESISDTKAIKFKTSVGNAITLGRELKNPHCNKERLEKIIRDIEQECPNDTILLSSEIMSAFKKECFEELVKVFKTREIEFTVVYYVRAIGDHLVSSYHQNIKRNAYFKSFDEYITRRRNGFAPRIKLLVELVGRERLLLKNYDKLSRENIFEDFVDSVLKIENKSELEMISKQVNRSLNEDEIELMKFINKSIHDKEISKLISDAIIHNNPDESYEFSVDEDQARKIREFYEDDLLYINEFFEENLTLELFSKTKINDIDKGKSRLSVKEKALASILVEILKRSER